MVQVSKLRIITNVFDRPPGYEPPDRMPVVGDVYSRGTGDMLIIVSVIRSGPQSMMHVLYADSMGYIIGSEFMPHQVQRHGPIGRMDGMGVVEWFK